MSQSRTAGGPGPAASAAKWSVAAALAATAAALLWLVGGGWAQEARPGSAAAPGGSVLIVAGQVTGDSYGLYLVDTRSSTMCVYQWKPSPSKPGVMELRLMAARNYSFDLQLDDFNNQRETSPSEIRKMVEQQRRLSPATQPQ